MVTGGTYINTDLACNRAMDPDMAIGSSLGLDIIKALGGSTSHSYQPGPGSSTALRCQHGRRWHQAPGILEAFGVSAQILAAVGPGTQTWPLAGAQDPISPSLLQFCLLQQHRNYSASLFPPVSSLLIMPAPSHPHVMRLYVEAVEAFSQPGLQGPRLDHESFTC